MKRYNLTDEAEIDTLRAKLREAIKAGDWARAEATEVKGIAAEIEPLRSALAAAEREIARLREGVECHVAQPGEGTCECRVDAPCPACRLRDAERERDEALDKALRYYLDQAGIERRGRARYYSSALAQLAADATKKRVIAEAALDALGICHAAMERHDEYECHLERGQSALCLMGFEDEREIAARALGMRGGEDE